MEGIKSLYAALEQAGIISISPWDQNSVIWLPKGLLIRANYINLLRSILLTNEFEEFLFPAFIPESLLRRQYEHYRDIKNISYALDKETFLRSTSECQFASYINSCDKSNRIRKIFQVCSVFRKESADSLIPQFRDVEINPFIELMSFTHNSVNELVKETTLFTEIFKSLCIPVLGLVI